MNNVYILAQTEANEMVSGIISEPATEQNQTKTVVSDANSPELVTPLRKPAGYSNLIFLGLIFVVMYFLLFRGPRKKQQQHKQMLQSLQKNDRVRTIGGIVGTIVDVKGDEITLKVDESNNTKLKIASSAIGRNLSKDKS